MHACCSCSNRTFGGHVFTSGYAVDFDNQCNSLYIGQLSVNVVDSNMAGHNSNSWWKILRFQCVYFICKLESGAQSNAMSLVTYEGQQKAPVMRPTSSSLVTYNSHRIIPLGVVTLAVNVKSMFRQLDFYIVSHDVATIISLPLCTQLYLIRCVDTIVASTLPITPSDDFSKAYSDVFGGLSRYYGEFHIELREGTVTFIHPCSLSRRKVAHFAYASTRAI